MSPMNSPNKSAQSKLVPSSSKKKKKPGRKDRLVLRAQGVEFDTGDETSGADTRQLLRKVTGKMFLLRADLTYPFNWT